MTETLSFPGLGLEFEIGRVAFSIFGIDIYWYGLLFAAAFICGIIYFHLRSRSLGFHSYDGLDVLLWAVVGGVVGARLYFVVFRWELYKDNWLRIFAFREGGLALYGGVIGALIAGFIACRIKKMPILPLLDAGFPAMLLAQAIGRWGNFFNMEAFGCNTTLPWGMTSRSIVSYLVTHEAQLEALGMTIDPAVPVHPTFLYESIWNFLGFLVLAFILTPRRKYDGQVFLGYVAWYGFGRYFVEGLRTDSLTMGATRVSEALGIVSCAVALVLMVVFYFLNKREPKPAFLGLYVETEESRERILQVERQLEEEKQAARDKKAGVKAGEPEVPSPAGEDAAPPEAEPAEEGSDATGGPPADVTPDGSEEPSDGTDGPEPVAPEASKEATDAADDASADVAPDAPEEANQKAPDEAPDSAPKENHGENQEF